MIKPYILFTLVTKDNTHLLHIYSLGVRVFHKKLFSHLPASACLEKGCKTDPTVGVPPDDISSDRKLGKKFCFTM